MNTYTTFFNQTLLALYRETTTEMRDAIADPIERRNRALANTPQISVIRILKNYGISYEFYWIRQFARECEAHRLASFARQLTTETDIIASIEFAGIRYVESKLIDYLSSGQSIPNNDINIGTADISPRAENSKLYNGFGSTQHKEQLSIVLRRSISDIDTIVLTNSERAAALSLLRAASELSESSEPPHDLIWKIIFRASAVSGVGTLLVAAIDLYLHS